MIIQALEKNQFVEAEKSQKRYKISKGFEDELCFSIGADGREITAVAKTTPEYKEKDAIIEKLEKRISQLEEQLKTLETEKSKIQKEEKLPIQSKLNKDDNDVLEIASHYPDGIMMQDLIKELAAKQPNITQGTVRYKASVATDKLKEMGLITKERKRKEVKISPIMKNIKERVSHLFKKEETKSEDFSEKEIVSPERIDDLVKLTIEFLNSQSGNLTRGISLQELKQQIGVEPEEEKPFLESIEEKCHIIGNPVEPENCYIRLKLESQRKKDKEPEEIKIETDQAPATEKPFWKGLPKEPLKENFRDKAVPTAIVLIRNSKENGVLLRDVASKCGFKKIHSKEIIETIQKHLETHSETLEIINPETFENCVLKMTK